MLPASALFWSGWGRLGMGNKWTKCTLSKISDIQTGPFGSQLHASDYVPDGIPSIMPQNIGDNRINEDGIARITRDDAQRLEKYRVKTGDIVYSRRGDVELRAFIREKENGWLCGTGCLRVRISTTDVDSKFASFYLSTPWSRAWTVQHAHGATMPNLNTSILGEVPFAYPDLVTQRSIAATLSCLDEKIELNNRIIANLEAQAQAIFKSWFVDYEPFQDGEFVESELGLIPKGWKVGTFSEIIEKLIPGDWGKDNPEGNNTHEVFCIRGADIPEVRNGNKGKMPVRYILPKNFISKQLETNDLVIEISGGSPTQSTGRIALITQSLLSRYDKPMVCTNFCKAIKPKEGFAAFVYYYWQFLYDMNVLFSYENGTTGIKNLNINGFVEVESIVIPDDPIAIKFNEIVMGFQEMVFSLGKQNEQLALTRDTLLPKLMSGEIEVPVEV